MALLAYITAVFALCSMPAATLVRHSQLAWIDYRASVVPWPYQAYGESGTARHVQAVALCACAHGTMWMADGLMVCFQIRLNFPAY